MVAMLKCALLTYGGNAQWGDIISVVIFPNFYSSVFSWIIYGLKKYIVVTPITF